MIYPTGDEWTFRAPDGSPRRVRGPKEFRHSMETLLNGPIELGFALLQMSEDAHFDPEDDAGAGIRGNTCSRSRHRTWGSGGDTGRATLSRDRP